jgi:UDP-N-acetylmuramoyl-tripeptide--D-alanyl-D-alanine ligase
VIALTAAEIAAATGGEARATGDGPLVVSGAVVTDSRDVEAGGLFVALPGEHVDGHDYAARAVSAGAALVLA